MTIFHCDLDNTLIYSYKQNLNCPTINVEIYDGREISFMTINSHDMLPKINKKTIFVPTTTRSIEQYQRIDLGFVPEYALVCNGGLLLVNGEIDKTWYEQSLAIVAKCSDMMAIAQSALECDCDVNFEVRFISELFIFTKSANPKATISRIRALVDETLVSVHQNGVKVYVVPKGMDKGSAVARFKSYIEAKTGFSISNIAAGDSDFDVPMLRAANRAIVPKCLADFSDSSWDICSSSRIYSDELLTRILDYMS